MFKSRIGMFMVALVLFSSMLIIGCGSKDEVADVQVITREANAPTADIDISLRHTSENDNSVTVGAPKPDVNVDDLDESVVPVDIAIDVLHSAENDNSIVVGAPKPTMGISQDIMKALGKKPLDVVVDLKYEEANDNSIIVGAPKPSLSFGDGLAETK